MTVIFIAWGHYDGFKDAVKCAETFAGCPVHVVSENPVPCQNQHRIQDCPQSHALLTKLQRETGDNRWTYLIRWLLLKEFIDLHPELDPPWFAPDWDVLFFRPLSESYQPFLQDDYVVSIHDEFPFPQSAAYCINTLGALVCFCELVHRIIGEHSAAYKVDDMSTWAMMQRESPFWKVGDLNEIHNGSVFDHNIHCGKARFKMDGQAKRITWVNQKPEFTGLNGVPITANTIHCWGTYKGKTGDLLRKAGL